MDTKLQTKGTNVGKPVNAGQDAKLGVVVNQGITGGGRVKGGIAFWSSSSGKQHLAQPKASEKSLTEVSKGIVEDENRFKKLCEKLPFDQCELDFSNLCLLGGIQYPSSRLFYDKKTHQEKINYCNRQLRYIKVFREKLLAIVKPELEKLNSKIFERRLSLIEKKGNLSKLDLVNELNASKFTRIDYIKLREIFQEYQLRESLSSEKFSSFITDLYFNGSLKDETIQEFIEKSICDRKIDRAAEVFDKEIEELPQKIELSLIFMLMVLSENLDRTRLWWAGAKDRIVRGKADKMPFDNMRQSCVGVDSVMGSREELETYILKMNSMSEDDRLEFCSREFKKFTLTLLGNDAITKHFWEAEGIVVEYRKMLHLIRAGAVTKALINGEPKSLEFYLRILDPIRQKDLFEMAQKAKEKGTWDGVKVFLAIATPIISLAIAIFVKIAIDQFSSLEGPLLAISILLLMMGKLLGVFLGAHFGFKAEEKAHQRGIELMKTHMESIKKSA